MPSSIYSDADMGKKESLSIPDDTLLFPTSRGAIANFASCKPR